MAFNAGQVVESLDFDFRPYVNAHGTIAEPTDDQVRKMNLALRDATLAVTGQDVDPEDRAAMARAFGKLTDEQLRAMEAANVAAIAIVTGTAPAAGDLDGLPFRIKREFIKWLIRELNDPEGSATATKP